MQGSSTSKGFFNGLLLLLILLPSKLILAQLGDCLREGGRRTVYTVVIKPTAYIKIYNKMGNAANGHNIIVQINEVTLKTFNSKGVEAIEWQNNTNKDQTLKITANIVFEESKLNPSTVQLSYEDLPCKKRRERYGDRGGGVIVCDCNPPEPDYDDAFMFIQTF